MYKGYAVNNNGQDNILLQGLAAQDKASIEIIYRDNFQMVQTMVLNNRGTTDDAADIFQEAMIVLFEKSVDPDFVLTCQIKTYLYSVSRRTWLKKLQKQQRTASHTDDFEQVVQVDEDLDEHKQKQVSFEIMETALAKIGDPCKSLLEAYYIHKKPMHQIASDFNYTNADNAKTQKYKCLVRLKKIFFAEYKNLK